MDWFKNLKIGTKLIVSIGIIYLMFIGITLYLLLQTKELAALQDSGAERALHAVEIGKIQTEVTGIYTHIADCIINKDVTDSKKSLENDKTDMNKNIALIKEIVDTKDEIEWADIVEKNYSDYLAVYENKLIPLIENYTAESDQEIAVLDSQIDKIRENVLSNLEKISTSLQSESKEGDQLYDETRSSTVTLMLILLVVSSVISIFLTLFVAEIIKKPIIEAMNLLKELSLGHVGKRLNSKTKDEIGIMGQTMDSFADDLQNNIVNNLIKVSEGDTSINLKRKDDNDEITPALVKLVDTLRSLVTETKKLADSAVVGDLKMRGNTDKFGGGYKEIIQGVNNTLDAVISPIQEGSLVLQVMATGDFTRRVTGTYKGDLKIIKDNINQLGVNVGEMISDVANSIQATASASNQISSSSEEMAAGAQEQSSQTSEVATAIEEMTKTIMETSSHATKASHAAKNSGDIAREGGKVVNETINGMNQIAEVVKKSADTVQTLGKSSDQIGEIVQVIDDIADQTNLLALNAAIEAARAGEQGRGFAVVADEVRKLAERTTKATKEIASMIKQIQKDTVEAVESMRTGTVEVEKGKALADKAGQSLKQIIEGADEVVDLVMQVAAASEEQSSAAEQIGKNIDGINNVTQESTQGIQQIAKASEDLNNLTVKLQDVIGKFKITDTNSADDNNSLKQILMAS